MTYTNKVNTKNVYLENFLNIDAHHAFHANPKKFISENLNTKQQKILNSLLYFDAQHPENRASQNYLAQYAGYKSRATGNRVIKKLHTSGIITKDYRHRKTCTYGTSKVFDDFHVRKSLQDILPALKWFPIKWLFVTTLMLKNKQILDDTNSILSRFNSENVTPYTKELFLKALSAKLCACARTGEKCANIKMCLNNPRLYLMYKDAIEKQLAAAIEKQKIAQKEQEEAMKKELLTQIVQKFGLEENDVLKLGIFPEDVLELAMSKMQRKLLTTKIDRPGGYFFTLCKILVQEREKAKQEVKMALSDEALSKISVPKSASTGTMKDISRQVAPFNPKNTYKPTERDYKESWRLPAGELARRRAEGLARVPESMRKCLADLHDACYKQAYTNND